MSDENKSYYKNEDGEYVVNLTGKNPDNSGDGPSSQDIVGYIDNSADIITGSLRDYAEKVGGWGDKELKEFRGHLT